MIKKHSFVLVFLLLIVISFAALHLLYKHTSYINSNNELFFGNVLLGFFVLSMVVLFVPDLLIPSLAQKIKFPPILLYLSICLLLLLSIFDKQIGIYGTAFFIFCTLVYLAINGKIYKLNPIYLLVFTYPLLEFIGTIGTPGGFRFPDMTLTFYLIPVAFCCFRIDKEALIRILRFVFRIVLVFMVLSVINWYFNKLQTGVSMQEWISKKVCINTDRWAYEFVASWAHYKHPSYIDLVLFPVLISGFYIYYKHQETSVITKFEMLFFVLLCLFMQLIMESRIGIVGVMFILLFTGLYYLHLKKIYFKIAIVILFVVGIGGVLKLEHSVNGFIADPARKTFSTFAIQYIKGHIWWGAGYYQEASVLGELDKDLSINVPLRGAVKTYVHNQLLGTMVQFGIPGAIVLIALMFGLLWYAFKTRSYILQVFICVYILFMFIEEPLYVQEGITRFMVFLTFFIHLGESEKKVQSYKLWSWKKKELN